MRPQDRAKFNMDFFGIHQRRWKRAMWDAIQDAAGNNSIYANKVLPIHGLRAIRFFEEVNGVEFDPFNRWHRETVWDCRPFFARINYHKGVIKHCDTMLNKMEELRANI